MKENRNQEQNENHSGIKDCSDCTVLHRRDNYGYIIGKFKEIVEITKLDD